MIGIWYMKSGKKRQNSLELHEMFGSFDVLRDYVIEELMVIDIEAKYWDLPKFVFWRYNIGCCIYNILYLA